MKTISGGFISKHSYFRNLIYLGGIRQSNLPQHESSIDNRHSSHFRQHVARIFECTHELYDNIDASIPTVRFPYQATAYIISSQGARDLLRIVDQLGGLVRPVSSMIMDMLESSDGCYTAYPLLTRPLSDGYEEVQSIKILTLEEMAAVESFEEANILPDHSSYKRDVAVAAVPRSLNSPTFTPSMSKLHNSNNYDASIILSLCNFQN